MGERNGGSQVKEPHTGDKDDRRGSQKKEPHTGDKNRILVNLNFFVPVLKKGRKIYPHVSNLRSCEFLFRGIQVHL